MPKDPSKIVLADATWRRQLSALPSKKKLDALIDSPRAQELVRKLPAEELYAAIADVGLADATEIVQLASPSQFRTFVDLGGWERDRLSPHQVLTWLRAARGDEDEDFMKKVHGLDLEVLEILLRTFSRVHDREESQDLEIEGVTFETPEGKYLIELTVEGAEMSAMRSLLNDLIAENPFESVRLFEAVRWEVPSELEEIAYRFRSARLEDLGFPELYAALSIFTFVDPDTLRAQSAGESASLAPRGERIDFIGAAFAALEDDEREAAEAELRYLANSALVADGADPGDLEAARRVAEQMRDTLSLGFDHATGGAVERAADVLRAHPPKRIFQVGFSLGLKLKFRADRLAKEPLARLEGEWLLLSDERAALTALRRKRPLRALKVEGAEPVAFRSRRELADSEALLARAESQVKVFRAVLGGAAADGRAAIAKLQLPMAELTADRLWATIVAWAVLDGAVHLDPLPSARLKALAEQLVEPGNGSPRVREAARARVRDALTAGLTDAEPELTRMVDLALSTLAEELGGPFLSTGSVEPKAVASIVLGDATP